jgi:hypothetical protein
LIHYIFLGFSCSWFEEWWYCSTACGAAFLAEGDFKDTSDTVDSSILVTFFIICFELTVDYILQHTPLEQLDRKHFAKVPCTKDGSNTTSNGNNVKDDMKKEIALMEVKMRRLCELLDEVSSLLLPVFLRVILDAWYTQSFCDHLRPYISYNPMMIKPD